MPNSPKIYSVSELNRLAQDLLEERFSGIWVEGEISNYRGPSGSGHCYFSIKDDSAQVDVVAFRGVMGSLRFRLEDGLKVLVCGRVSLYAQRGRFQVIASALEPRGAGALQLAFEQLKKKLESEGLFDPSRKRPIPAYAGRIGIVTSPAGAAIHDILTVINRRFANVEILIYPAKVQGEGAKEDISAGIEYLNLSHPDLDVLLVGRGGGSIEDLWAFNEEIVARAISSSRIPVISCVGHEVDFTIADFVADLRAPTPSAAAEMVVKDKSEIRSGLEHLFGRLRQSLDGALDSASETLKGLVRSPAFTRPERFFEAQSQNLDHLWSKLALLSPRTVMEEKRTSLSVLLERILQSGERRLETARDVLRISAGRLEALSPLAVLARGYAIAWSGRDGAILKSASRVAAGDPIRVKLHQGEIRAVAQDVSIGETKNDQERSGIEERQV